MSKRLQMKELDKDKLIELIRVRPPVWDQKDPHYHDRVVLDTLWKEIYTEMDAPRSDVRVKWKTLRDTFRKEYRRVNEENTVSRWKCFDQLLFLKGQFPYVNEDGTFGRSSANIEYCDVRDSNDTYFAEDSKEFGLLAAAAADDSDNYDYNNCNEGKDVLQTTDVNSKMLVLSKTSNSSKKVKPESRRMTRKRKYDKHNDDDNEEQNEYHNDDNDDDDDGDVNANDDDNDNKSFAKLKLKYLKLKMKNLNEEKSTNDDSKFLESMLPHINTLTPADKMLLRIKMQELVYNFVYVEGRNANKTSDKSADLK